jgi:cytochrome oxidase Cu insertion factor (SCO1/SenC/PrrC family)
VASFVALVIGLSLAMILATTVLLLVRRKRRPSTPADRYQRDMQKIQLDTHLVLSPGTPVNGATVPGVIGRASSDYKPLAASSNSLTDHWS